MMIEILLNLQANAQALLGVFWMPVWTLLKIIAIVAPLMIGVAYFTYAERKILAYMQVRVGSASCVACKGAERRTMASVA